MKKHRAGRVTRRFPELVEGLGQRLKTALVSLDVRQQDLAEELGGYRPDAISFLVNGKSSQVAIDCVIRLAEYMHGRGVSLPWLFCGVGEMMLADELAGDGSTIETTDIVSYAMLIAMGRKLGLDLEAIANAWHLQLKVPGRGIVEIPVAPLAERIERAIADPAGKTPPKENRKRKGDKQ